jgi:hypothetical protein
MGDGHRSEGEASATGRPPPHPATVAQPKAPHPATAGSRFAGVGARPPHPATVAQPKPAFTGVGARPPHPATVAQPKPRPLPTHQGVAWPPRRRGVAQAAILPPAPLVPPIPAVEFEPKNDLIRASYDAFIPHVNNFADCGLKVQGLLKQLRRGLRDTQYTVDDMGLTVRIVRIVRISVAGVGTDILVSEYMTEYQGNWEALVNHAIARAADPSLAGTFDDWYG